MPGTDSGAPMDDRFVQERKFRRRVQPKGEVGPRRLRPAGDPILADEEVGEAAGPFPGDRGVGGEETLG